MDRAGVSGPVTGHEHHDRLGERSVGRSGDGAAAETFAVCRELSANPEFRAALAAPADGMVASGRGLARILGVDVPQAVDGRVTIRQEWVPGERLADVAARRRRQGRPFTLAHALFVLRECAAALRALHARGAGTCHGAISAHRILITSDDHLVLCETVIGRGLAAMSAPREWFADTLGLALPSVPGVPPFTPLTDQLQLGRLVVEMLAGMPAAMRPAQLQEQLDALTPLAADGSAHPLGAAWTTLIGRMLLLAPEGPYRSMAALERALDLALAEPGGVDPAPPPIEAPEVPPPTQPPVQVVPAHAWVALVDAAPASPPADADVSRHMEAEAPPLAVGGDPPVPPVPEAGRGGLGMAGGHQPFIPGGREVTTPFALGAGNRSDSETHRIHLAEALSQMGGVEGPLSEPASRVVFVPRSVPPSPRSRAPSARWLAVAGIAACIVLAAGAAWHVLPRWGGAADAPTGWLHLESKPSGATVAVNGEQKGLTPLTLALPAGAYAVEFVLNGETRSLTVPVTAQGEAFQLVSLYPPGPPGTIAITSVPSGALVSLDGVSRGRTPVVIRDVAPGEHQLRLENGAAAIERSVEVLAGARVELAVPLSGTVVVDSPFEVTVTEGDTTLGRSGGALAVRAGTRRLTFANPTLNFEEARDVEVEAGQLTRVVIDPPTGVINLDADTSAQVFLDGRPLGVTPLPNVPVSLGTHEVLFRDARGGEVRYVIVVALGPAYRLKASLATQPPKRGVPHRR